MNIFLSPSNCAVVIVNYNSSAFTLKCLRSISRLLHPPGHIVVVDNGSHPDDADQVFIGWSRMTHDHLHVPVKLSAEIPSQLPRTIFLPLSQNLGFSGGNNAALRLLLSTKAQAFWLLNNDTEPHQGALDALCRRLNDYEDAGVCGSTLVYPSDLKRVQCAAGGKFTPWSATSRHVGVNAYVAKLPKVERIEKMIDYVIGASMLVRRSVFEVIGLLPEEYFLYCEDVDFCLSAKRAGFELAWARDSIVPHHEGGSSGYHAGSCRRILHRSRFVDYLSVRNRYYLVRKFFPLAIPASLLCLPAILVKRMLRGQMDRCGLLVSAVKHGLVRSMGLPTCR